MHDLAIVSRLQSRGDLGHESDDVRERQLDEPIRAIGQDLAIEERHDEIHEPIRGLTEIFDVADVGMDQLPRQLRLPTQPSHRRGVLRERRREHLDRVPRARRGLGRQIDEGHPALTKLSLDQKAPVESLSDERRVCGYAGRRELAFRERRALTRGHRSRRPLRWRPLRWRPLRWRRGRR